MLGLFFPSLLLLSTFVFLCFSLFSPFISKVCIVKTAPHPMDYDTAATGAFPGLSRQLMTSSQDQPTWTLSIQHIICGIRR